MKNNLTNFSLFIVLIISWACDPVHNVNYSIKNESESNIHIVSKLIFREDNDTSSISRFTELVLFNDFGIGKSTKDYIDDLETLPFDSIVITNDKGVLPNKNIMDLNNWTKFKSDKEPGQVILTIRNKDFE